jgi:hypothetical protein
MWTKRITPIVLGLTLFATPLGAQQPDRVLNGYRFIPSGLVPDPFAVSYFGSGTGGGMAFDLETPFVDLDGDTLGTLIGDVAFLALDFEYQQRFGNWLAVRAGLIGVGRVGVDEQSVLAQGVTGVVGWNLGATARIWQNRNLIVSAALDFGRSDLVALDPFEFARSVVDEGLDTDNSLVATTNAISTRASGRFGWAPADWIGVTAVLEGGVGDVTESDNEVILGGGGTVGVDLGQLSSIPIGLLLSLESEAFTFGGSDLSNRSTGIGFGVFYTAWEDFSIGLEATRRQLELRESEKSFAALLAAFRLRYYF